MNNFQKFILMCSLMMFFTHNYTILGQSDYKIFGHRGCRGIYPENTIKGFEKAIQLGVDGIELDVVVSKDLELIISHEPYVDTSYCKIEDLENSDLNIYKMNFEEIKKIDCGTKFVKNFPEQKKIIERKPTFKELEKSLNNYGGIILFEIKSDPHNINKYYPDYPTYANIIYNETKESKLLNNIVFMSFDAGILNELKKIIPNSSYVFLSEYYDNKTLNSLKFKPSVIGIKYESLDKETIKKIHKKNQMVYAWTVNSKDISEILIEDGIDGIITDFPNLITK